MPSLKFDKAMCDVRVPVYRVTGPSISASILSVHGQRATCDVIETGRLNGQSHDGHRCQVDQLANATCEPSTLYSHGAPTPCHRARLTDTSSNFRRSIRSLFVLRPGFHGPKSFLTDPHILRAGAGEFFLPHQTI